MKGVDRELPKEDMARQLTNASLAEATRQLAEIDSDLGDIVARLGVPPMWGRRPGFAALLGIILEQQVSLAAARTLYQRLDVRLGGLGPEGVYAMGEEGLRQFGLTRQKARYCHGLAERVLDGRLDLAALARGHDEQGRAALLAVPGLGPWSVDIYYLMALRRPDVWPRGDLALASALQQIKRLDSAPGTAVQQALAGAWAPWRAVAARLIWAHYLAVRGKYPAR
jgi:DNA-3-methyladenine glycosylase II